MRKLSIFTILVVLVSISMPLFALVTVKAENGQYSVTITYKNPNAKSVGLVGDMQGWQLEKALPMAKSDADMWSITLKTKSKNKRYLYKFNVDGQWTEDPAAPATVDDGFGGNNALIVLKKLLKN